MRQPPPDPTASPLELAKVVVQLAQEVRAATGRIADGSLAMRDRETSIRLLLTMLKNMGVSGEDVTQICSEVMRK